MATVGGDSQTLSKATPLQIFELQRRKLSRLGNDIKGINEQGRLAASDQNQLTLFKGMFRTLQNIYDQFSGAWDVLLELQLIHDFESGFPTQGDMSVYSNVKRYYFEANAKYEQLVHGERATNTSHESTQNVSQFIAPVRAHLPKINLPEFHGQLSEWPTFRDTFTSLVHNEPHLNKIEKYHFLISSLHNQARTVIKNIPLEEESYDQAWQALLKAYDNKRELASNYLSILLSYKPIQGKPSVSSLKHFLSTISESVAAFKRLKISKPDEFILFELALRCLDPHTREAFELENTHLDFPEYNQLIKFVETRCKALARLGSDNPDSIKTATTPNRIQSKVTTTSSSNFKRSVLFAHSSQQKQSTSGTSRKSTTSRKNDSEHQHFSCVICNKHHKIADCPTYISCTPRDRLQLLNKFKVCKNCLFPFHMTSSCTSKWNCRICHLRHHTTLHLTTPRPTSDAVSIPPTISSDSTQKATQSSPTAVLSGTSVGNIGALLGTALASIKNKNGSYQAIRLVVDCGSQHSFITQSCVASLGITPKFSNQRISGLGESTIMETLGQVRCSLKPLSGLHKEISSEAIIVPSITSILPQCTLPFNLWKSYQHLELADPNFWKPGPIDFLLGADLYPQIIKGLPIMIVPSQPYALNTIFGHLILGALNIYSDSEESNQSTSLLITEESMTEVISKFWQIEEVATPLVHSDPEDLKCEEHFLHTHYRLSSGRYVVRLPFKNSSPELGPSRQRALSRFFNLEAKLSKNPLISAKYHQFLNEYLELQHMNKTCVPGKYIIPHHAIVKTDAISGDIKLRVVFDASAKTAKGSLNDHLMTGPKLQKDIGNILLNFRQHAVVFTADIIKMYRQILIHEQDRGYQHILWRFNEEHQAEEYELNTITYGISAAPFLALRVIQQLVQDEGTPYPLASIALNRDIYVDDILTGAPTLSEALTLQEEIIQLLGKAGFELSKWSSNHPEILHKVNKGPNDNLVSIGAIDDHTIKILGIQWDPKLDVFSYHVQIPAVQFTKRSILSTIARIYDPLGYLAPVVFYAKHILQLTWIADLDWDESVPDDIGKRWSFFVNQLTNLSNIKISRHIPRGSDFHYSIFGYCDASEKGYCSVIYIQVATDTETTCHLLKAKTKLAPLKTRSIPCLELCAAALLVQLYQSLANFLKCYIINQTFFFTDSTVVLAWLKTPPHRLKTFVANRVVQITNHSKRDWWHHIKGEDNPADAGSRGIMPIDLINNHLWWAGPSWTCLPYNQWPSCTFPEPADLPELKANPVALTTTTAVPEFILWMERFSSYTKLIRVFAYLLRFCQPTHITNRRSGPICADEFENASRRCISLLQSYFYPDSERRQDSSIYRSLNVFRDDEGLLRVGGRLRHSSLPEQVKFPFLLPRRCHFNNLLIDHYHRINMHIGPSALQAIIAQKVWIPAARSLIRQRKLKCLNCFKLSQRPQAPYMGDLPASRFAEYRPFQNVGMDFAGPFLCRESLRRKAAITKAYLCVFVCLSSKALHLEIVNNLSTEAFLDAFDRFVARRGLPSKVFSDCGTNFVGAFNYLKEVNQWYKREDTRSNIIHHVASSAISWSFNPPSSPHFGGIWEAGVKSAKGLLVRTIGNHPYTKDELSTIFTKVEGILNSRPIIPLSSDPSDLQPLTPGHFLIGQAMNALPEINLDDVPENRLSRWQHLRQKMQLIWERWRKEYLHTLQQRRKWMKARDNVNVGDLVLFEEPNLPPLKWPLARIIAVHPGKDNIVRVVTLRTAHGTFQRPVAKIVPLTLT